MIKRSERVAFMNVGTSEAPSFKRMTGFTELSTSKNPKEYSRKYVDENSERTSITGYATSMAYKFDYEPDNEVHKKLCDISDNELTGGACCVTIVMVDLASPAKAGGSSFNAVCRNFTVVPSGEGDDTEVYTFSGDFKADGDTIYGTATTQDEWQTATFTENE